MGLLVGGRGSMLSKTARFSSFERPLQKAKGLRQNRLARDHVSWCSCNISVRPKVTASPSMFQKQVHMSKTGCQADKTQAQLEHRQQRTHQVSISVSEQSWLTERKGRQDLPTLLNVYVPGDKVGGSRSLRATVLVEVVFKDGESCGSGFSRWGLLC